MKKRTREILDIMDRQYGTDLKCYLTHDSAWQLLIATILSAQCTDARVNIVTKDLFVKYPDIRAFAEADLHELEQDIKSTGFYHNKAKNIIACCRKLHEDFGDEVPSDIESLTSLPGVGRKTANVVRGNIFGIESIVVDTHVKRVSGKLGLTMESDPVKIEYDLMKEIPKDHWILVNFQFIAFGRDICKAIRPDCDRCPFTKYCNYIKKTSR
ncbi:MAG: endonuclease III [Lachnospiraceae bacterium]|nr:endonuclease III [Lachnospiraceae bacterium]